MPSRAAFSWARVRAGGEVSVPVTRQDPYPIGQRLFIHDERLTGLIVRNLHHRIRDRKAASTSG